MLHNIIFKVDNKGIIHTCIRDKECDFKHVVPLINEDKQFCNTIGIYSKNGWISAEEEKFIDEYSEVFKFVFLTASGPYYEKNYRKIYKKYDGVMGLNTCSRIPVWKYNNNLELNYSMMARSGPEIDGFYYQNTETNINSDFSILTWYKDKNAKVWKDAYKIIIELCSEGYKGILINQRGDTNKIINDRKLRKFIDNGKLEVYGTMDPKQFHNITCRARVGIFPNKSDAFPKHIIECLLQDKSIVISPDLLFGVDTLRELGEETVLVQSFSDRDCSEKIMTYIDNRKRNMESVSPRYEWINRYEFDKLCGIWAKEICKVVNHESAEKIFCMRHLPRFFHETLEINI